MRRVSICALEHLRPKDPSTSLGVASILCRLPKDTAHRTFNVNSSVAQFDPEEAVDWILSQPAEFVALGAFVWNEPYITTITKRVKEYGKTVILGGANVTYAPAGTLKSFYPHADIFIRGSAEAALENFAKGVDLENIKGIFNASGDRVDTAEQATLLPPNHGFISPITEKLYTMGAMSDTEGFIRWETQRGCPFACSFCQHRQPDKTGGARVQKIDLTRINDELKILQKWAEEGQNGRRLKSIAVVDPTFNMGPEHAKWILGSIPAGVDVSLQVRPEKISEEFIATCLECKANLTLELGVQSLNPDELAVVERTKGSDPAKLAEKVLRKLSMLDGTSLKYTVSLIFGLPRQTVQSFEKTLATMLRFKAQRVEAWPLMLLRGTPLEARKEELRLVEDYIHHPINGRLQEYIKHVVETPTMTRSDWELMANMATEALGTHND